MRTAIISCGPSCELFQYRHYDTIIGVNWIPTRYSCDWVCCRDRAMLGIEEPDQPMVHKALWSPSGECRVLGKPNYFIHWYALYEIAQQRPEIAEALRHEFVMTWPDRLKEIPYTGLAPLFLLHILGIDTADLYGYDMIGDIDGRDNTSTSRTPERWEIENNLFKELTERFHLNLMLIRE